MKQQYFVIACGAVSDLDDKAQADKTVTAYLEKGTPIDEIIVIKGIELGIRGEIMDKDDD